MVGQHNSSWSRIKVVSPSCVQMKCICHSLALCEEAFRKLPSHISHLPSEVPWWFCNSVLRRDAFHQLFKVMDPNEERNGTPSPFEKTLDNSVVGLWKGDKQHPAKLGRPESIF